MLWFIYNCLRLSHENKTNHRFALIISFLLDINFEMEVVIRMFLEKQLGKLSVFKFKYLPCS